MINTFVSGRGGSPPTNQQEALLEATRLTMWKLYNQGLNSGGMAGGMTGIGGGPPPTSVEEDRLNHPTHHPIVGVPLPPQKEALNLDVKDDVSAIEKTVNNNNEYAQVIQVEQFR